MHSLFTIDDLVREICSHLSKRDLCNVARVSSTWFHSAIPLLYRRQKSGVALLPLQKVTYRDLRTWTWNDNPIKEKNFERFRIKYAPHVQEISLDEMSCNVALEASRICASKGIPYLFPNARAVNLFWPKDNLEQWLEVLNHMITPNVDELYLYNINDPGFFHDVCQLAIKRISSLDYLEIEDPHSPSDTAVSSIAESTHELISFFTRTLASVYIPKSFDIFITKRLPNMPNLLDLSIGGDSPLMTEKPEVTWNRGNPDDLPTLRTFSYGGPPQFVHNTFWRQYNPTFLTLFHWDGATSISDIGTVVSKIVTACPRLIDLSLGLSFWSPWDRPSNAEEYAVPWSYIQPISLCKELTHLSLDRMIVSATPKDLIDFVKSRKTWVCVDIHPLEPLCDEDMLVYDKHCPKIEYLDEWSTESFF